MTTTTKAAATAVQQQKVSVPAQKFSALAMDPSKWRPSSLEERAAVEAQYLAEKAEWQRHARYRATIARHFVEDVHQHFRNAFSSLVKTYENTKALSDTDIRHFQYRLRELEGHHSAEDDMFFPQFARRIPETANAFEYLTKDHRLLHPLERKVIDEKDGAALVEFTSFLCDHLNREEMLLVPFMLRGMM